MSVESLREIIETAVADYGFRLATMWGVDDVVAMAGLSPEEATVLELIVVPELKELPNPVQPTDRPKVSKRLLDLAKAT